MRVNIRIIDEQRTVNLEKSQENVCKEIIELTKATGIHDLSIENDCAAILAREDAEISKVDSDPDTRKTTTQSEVKIKPEDQDEVSRFDLQSPVRSRASAFAQS